MHEPAKVLADQALAQLGLPLTAIFSTLGRTAARIIEARLFADQTMAWLDALIGNTKRGDVSVHKDGLIDNYQAVVPSTWNAGPRDAANQPGPYEAALMDRHRLHAPKQPLEIQRTIHSFDPCIACAVRLSASALAPSSRITRHIECPAGPAETNHFRA